MKKLFCDRCGEEIKIAHIHIWLKQGYEPFDICEPCANAFYRFMGIDTAGGGYEKLDSEVAEQ